MPCNWIFLTNKCTFKKIRLVINRRVRQTPDNIPSTGGTTRDYHPHVFNWHSKCDQECMYIITSRKRYRAGGLWDTSGCCIWTSLTWCFAGIIGHYCCWLKLMNALHIAWRNERYLKVVWPSYRKHKILFLWVQPKLWKKNTSEQNKKRRKINEVNKDRVEHHNHDGLTYSIRRQSPRQQFIYFSRIVLYHILH